MFKPTKLFWKVGKHVFRYLRGTTKYGIWYKQSKGVKLQGFTNADWVGSPSYRKITLLRFNKMMILVKIKHLH